MAKKPVIVVLAAGMGSRYGGLKQIDPVGKNGEAILDYSLYDAHAAGFETAVIIIKEAIREEFLASVGRRLADCPMQIRYAYQEMDLLPEGFALPQGREKPWGTCHAVLCAADAIDGAPFAVINADDYYGPSAFRSIYDALCTLRDTDVYNYCMVGYRLDRTVTENGSVSRGVCQVDPQGQLLRIDERTRVEQYPGGIHYTEDGGKTWTDLAPDSTVSMNLWGFTPSFADAAREGFPAFLTEALKKNPMKGEYQLPILVSDLVLSGKARVQVLTSADRWYGVTYAADKPRVQQAIREMTARGDYPDGLWK